MDEQRRIFLATAARLGALSALTSASGGALAQKAGALYPFSLGVASGSPLPDAVVIWTRILHDPFNAAATTPLAFSVRWEMAEDERFSRIVAKGTASAAPHWRTASTSMSPASSRTAGTGTASCWATPSARSAAPAPRPPPAPCRPA
jgi:phosphodiesterase/alkaline phosphatase D-like protein